MGSKRQNQTAEVIKRHFGNVLIQEGIYIYGDAFVTVTKVQVTPDISQAKIYLSVFNTLDKVKVLERIRDSSHILKRDLVKRIRRHVRRIPELSFYNDDTLDEMDKIDRLFNNLRRNNLMGEEE